MTGPVATIDDATAVPAAWTRVRSERPARWPMCALVVGVGETAEFAPVVAELRAKTEVTLVHDVASALRVVRNEDCSPDWLVLLESRPGELSRDGIDALRAAAPLARLVCVLGSWCEGEFRSGQPLPAAWRIYWHQFHGWFRQELAAIERGDCPELCLPITATEEERLLQNASLPASTMPSTPLCVAIHSNRREMLDLLREICESAGLSILPLPSHPKGTRGRGEGREGCALPIDSFEAAPAPLKSSHPADFVRHLLSKGEGSVPDFQPKLALAIWDLTSVEPPEIEAFAAAAARSPRARWIVLAGFVREETRAALLDAGACEVLSKPLVIEQLCAALVAACSLEQKGDEQLLLF